MNLVQRPCRPWRENAMSAGSSGALRRSSGSGAYRHGPSGSSSVRSSYEERCVDPVEDQRPAQQPITVHKHKAQLKNANGKEAETTGFIPGPSEPTSTQTCNPCASRRSCRTFVCSVLTCGLYKVCQNSILRPCLAPNESSPDEPEKISLQGVSPHDDQEEDAADWLGDVCIAGVKVESPREYLDVETRPPSHVRPLSHAAQPSHPSLHESLQFEDWEDNEENVDSLITKKLLELYSEYQIEELARCTSDSVFLNKSEDINHLINSLVEEHKMGEQEAECRLVRGIIRISTRKSTRKKPAVRRERTLSDSGNDTMRDSDMVSFSNNNDSKSNPNIQISELTSLDKCARELWRNNAGRTSSSPTSYSPSHTETNSSGVPLIRNSVRT
uniref:Keratinocyte differentiation factor 1b n=2 Tax=Takifugu rubripes TaxID=31033 RepID=A0A3B5KA19_TAKRU